MTRRYILKNLTLVIVFVAIVNLMASVFHWYYLVWWFDMPMHFLGGVSVFYLSALVLLPKLQQVSNRRFLFKSILGALFLGVLWEALELFLHIRYGSPDFILLDSISDVFFDLAGAFVGAFCLASALNTHTKEQM